MPVLIEFAGLPGSGKSTLVSRISKSIGVPAEILDPAGSRELLRRPLSVGRMARQSPLLLWAGRNRRTALNLALSATRKDWHESAPEPLLLEEGLAHHVWRALFAKPDLMRARWQSLLQRSHPLVVLETDRETQHQRIRSKRSPGRINQILLESGPAGSEWAWAVESFQEVLRVARQMGPTLTVDTSGQEDEAVDRVLSLVMSLLTPTETTP